MEKETLTSKIFALTAPYANPYQGNRSRWLFVCSAGLLRSPTAAAVGSQFYNLNTRSCGSSEYALIELNANLILWADYIVFVNQDNFKQALSTFTDSGYEDDIRSKALVWDIEDEYEAYDPKLIEIIKTKFDHYFNN